MKVSNEGRSSVLSAGSKTRFEGRSATGRSKPFKQGRLSTTAAGIVGGEASAVSTQHDYSYGITNEPYDVLSLT